MGWTSWATKNSTRAELAEHMGSYLGDRHTIVASTVVSSGLGRGGGYSTIGYYAVRTNDTDEVWALVVLAGKHGGEFFVKELDETMGPAETTGITASVLNALTPTDHEYANAWRERARANLNHRKQAQKIIRDAKKAGGALVRLTPITYTSLGEIDTIWLSESGDWYTADRTTRLQPMPNPWRYVDTSHLIPAD